MPQAYTNDPESSAYGGMSNGVGGSASAGEAERANAWESRFGWRVDLMAAASYLGGPITGESQRTAGNLSTQWQHESFADADVALLFLILETQNDYVRFHGRFLSSKIVFYRCRAC